MKKYFLLSFLIFYLSHDLCFSLSPSSLFSPLHSTEKSFDIEEELFLLRTRLLYLWDYKKKSLILLKESFQIEKTWKRMQILHFTLFSIVFFLLNVCFISSYSSDSVILTKNSFEDFLLSFALFIYDVILAYLFKKDYENKRKKNLLRKDSLKYKETKLLLKIKKLKTLKQSNTEKEIFKGDSLTLQDFLRVIDLLPSEFDFKSKTQKERRLFFYDINTKISKTIADFTLDITDLLLIRKNFEERTEASKKALFFRIHQIFSEAAEEFLSKTYQPKLFSQQIVQKLGKAA